MKMEIKTKMNMNKNFMDRMFRQVDGVVWDLMTGRIGFKRDGKIITLDLGELNEDKTEAPDAQVTENYFDDFGMAIPAFAQSIPPETITLGDIIYSGSNIMGWVVKKNAKSYKLMKPDGTRSDWTPPKAQILGFDSGIMVLRSLMNMLPNGAEGLGTMQGMLMPMMAMGMMDGDSDGLKSFLPLILMSQTGATGPAGSSMANMLPMMMMMNMMKGGDKSLISVSGKPVAAANNYGNASFFNK
jgi:hypothetical protein